MIVRQSFAKNHSREHTQLTSSSREDRLLDRPIALPYRAKITMTRSFLFECEVLNLEAIRNGYGS
jgi:hypothetical protein